jgi:hypothetical protein
MLRAIILIAVCTLSAIWVSAQTSVFTYQGRLTDCGTPANGTYDLEFRLFDAVTDGNQLPQPNPITITFSGLQGVSVVNGVFTVQLNFGGASVFDGGTRWLAIAVKKPADASFEPLTPRQSLNSTPYAIKSLNSTSADTATNSTQLGGVTASEYVVTTDSRMTDARDPLPNSPNYIQNTTSPQSSSNFNISGDGMASGTLSGNILNANQQFNIRGVQVLKVQGGINLDNTFVGVQAGSANSLGTNSFFGFAAGQNNSSFANSFFGANAGNSNTNGFNNSFFGSQAGQSNTTEERNTFIGAIAGKNNGSGDTNSFANDNSFVGFAAGSSNTTGTENSFFGSQAGSNNKTELRNTFIGESAGGRNGSGDTNNTANDNTFVGEQAGGNNTKGANNTFVGARAGGPNDSGNNNTVLGFNANTGANNLLNATAIGANASVTQSNSLVLGSINGENNATADTNVGIGITAPSARLHVSGTGPIRALINSGSNAGLGLALNGQNKWSVATVTGDQFQIFNDATGQNAVWIDSASNNVGIGTVSTNAKLTVNGTADKPGGGSWGVFSDERLKNIKGRFTSGLNAVMKLQPLRYEYRPDNALALKSEGEHVGFSAQAVQKIIPEAVTANKKGFLLVNNDPILWAMLNAIKEQEAQIQQQRELIQRQQALANRQQEQLKALTRLLGRPHRRARR